MSNIVLNNGDGVTVLDSTNTKAVPIDGEGRGIVNTYEDIANIRNPYLYMRVIVRNDSQDGVHLKGEYIITSLTNIGKVDTIGIKSFKEYVAESDPNVPAHVKAITQQNITDWNGKQDAITDANTLSPNKIKDNSMSNKIAAYNNSGVLGSSGIDTANIVVKSEMSIADGTGADAGTATIQLKSGTSKKVLTQHQSLEGKVDKVAGKSLSTNDYDNTEKGKVANAIQMPSGATSGKVLGYENGAVAWVDRPQDGEKGDKGDKGEDAVNPFKGYYPSGVSKPATGAVGDYIYAPPSDPQSTATATIWHYDSTQTPPWTDTEIDVSDVVGVEFGSGQSVPATKIKDENGEEVTGHAGVLSAEAGKELYENIIVGETESNGEVSEGVLENIDGFYIRFVIVNEDYPNGVIVPNYYDLGTDTDLNDNAITALRSNYDNNLPLYKRLNKNYYTLSAEYGSAQIAISPSDTITIKANENYPCFYTILKNKLTSSSTNPIEGAKGYGVDNSNIVRQIDAGDTETITVPSDGSYLYLYLGMKADGEGNRIFKPALIVINHSVLIKEWVENTNDILFNTNYVFDTNYVYTVLSGIRISNDGESIASTEGSFAVRYVKVDAGDVVQIKRLESLQMRSGSTTPYAFRVGFTAVTSEPQVGDSVYFDETLSTIGSVECPSIPPNTVFFKKKITKSCYMVLSGSSASNAIPNTVIQKGELINEKVEALCESTTEEDEGIAEKFKQAKFVNKDNTDGGLTLLHFSDIHGNKDCLYNIVAFINKWNDKIDDTICTGDLVSNSFANDFIFDDTVIDGASDILLCIGNHDPNDSSNWFSKVDTQEYYERYMGNASNWGTIYQPTDAATNYLCYYYKDYTQGVRLVVLDMMKWIKDMQTEQTNEQKEWLVGVLQDAATNKKHVVIAEHFPFTAIDTTDELIVPSLEKQADVVDSAFSLKGQHPAVSHATYPSGYSEFTYPALDELKDIVEDYINAEGDFNTYSKGVFVCYLAGHTHYDCFENVLETNQKMIVIGTASNLHDSKTIRNLRDNTVNLFNLLTIDTTYRVVKVFRVGGHMTPALQKIDTMSFEY